MTSTVPAPVIPLGEVGEPGPDVELEEAAAKAVKNMTYLAWRADMEGVPLPPPGPNYGPPEMVGGLICRICGREIRAHTVAEWHR